jgi:pSer/pThr/pTyr-binding forkhead associated (FHA) protein
VLAELEVLNTEDKGKTFAIHGPLTNIGRGEHNEIVLINPSVSDSHAKIQKRESGWHLVDIDSTNGTYVGGRRVDADQPLTGAPDLRFGDVKVAFRPVGETTDSSKSTRAIVGVSVEDAQRIAAKRAALAPPAAVRAPLESQEPASTPTTSGTPAWIWFALLIIAGAATYYFFFQARS